METRRLRKCGDCHVEPGDEHVPGCDVERCCLCGHQAISCDCVYVVNGMDRDRLELEHPDVYENGPTEAMLEKLEREYSKYGGRLHWSGEWPDLDTCRRMNLWSRWVDCETGKPIPFEPHKRPGKWAECKKGDKGADGDLNRLPRVARWDKSKRCWVDARN